MYFIRPYKLRRPYKPNTGKFYFQFFPKVVKIWCLHILAQSVVSTKERNNYLAYLTPYLKALQAELVTFSPVQGSCERLCNCSAHIFSGEAIYPHPVKSDLL